MSEAQEKIDFGKMARYVQDVADQQNSEERLQLGKIAGVLRGFDALTAPKAPDAEMPIFVVDMKGAGAPVQKFHNSGGGVIHVDGVPHAPFVLPDGFLLLKKADFDQLGKEAPTLALIRNKVGETIGAVHDGVDAEGRHVYLLAKDFPAPVQTDEFVHVTDGNGRIAGADYEGRDEDGIAVYQVNSDAISLAPIDAQQPDPTAPPPQGNDHVAPGAIPSPSLHPPMTPIGERSDPSGLAPNLNAAFGLEDRKQDGGDPAEPKRD